LIYTFEYCSLDTDRRELRRGGDLISTEPQVFDLLQFLISNRDRVVSKDDLIAAVWNGRIVSESTLTSRVTEARHAVGDSGEQQRLIRTIARKGLRFVGEVSEGSGTRSDHAVASKHERTEARASVTEFVNRNLPEAIKLPTLALPEKPSIVVLPFSNLSGDPTQEYFADGMVEDITIALGRLPWLFVIGSGSAFSYKNSAVDTRRVGAELGVRYVLRGSVRKAQNRVRITAQLTDAAHGGHIWADRFDGEINDVFEMQDRVAANVSATIAPALQAAEMKRTERKPTENLTAYDLFLRASRHQRDNVEQNRESLRLLYRAIELDPSYAAAYGLAAFCHFWQKVFAWVSPSDPALQEGVRLGHLAVEHGQNDSEALWMAAQTCAMLAGELGQAVDWVDKSTALNPNSPSAWWTGCLIRAFLGKSEQALENAARASRLDPLDPLSSTHSTGAGLAHFFAGRYEHAASMADQVLAKEPAFPPALRLKVAACGRLGRIDDGRAAIARLLTARPRETVAVIEDYYSAPLRENPSGLQDYLDGLRQAGLRDR
jgi:TolB-like protein